MGDCTVTTDRRDMSLRQRLAIVEDAPPWGLAGAVTGLAALLVCLIVVGPALASILLGSAAATPSLLMLSWALGMALCSVFVLVSRRSSAGSWAALRLARGNTPLPLALLYGVAIGLLLDLLVGLAGGRFLPAPAILGLPTDAASGIILAALLAVLLQPVAETLVFQALLLPVLRSKLGAWAGVALTCALMALLHILVFMAAVGEAYSLLWHGIVTPLALALAVCLLRVSSASSLAVMVARGGAGLMFLLTALALGG